MQWGLMVTASDNGDGDHGVGMDRIFHTDFAGMSAAWSTLAAEYR